MSGAFSNIVASAENLIGDATTVAENTVNGLIGDATAAFNDTSTAIGKIFGSESADIRANKQVEPSSLPYKALGVIWEIPGPGPNSTTNTNRIVIDHNINFQESAGVDWGVVKPRGSLGSIYTYNSTVERKFPLEFIITDYEGTGEIIRRTKRLLRQWVKPTTVGGRISSPPPVLGFYYNGFVEEGEHSKVIIESYTIAGRENTAWSSSSHGKTPHPYTLDISLNLIEIAVSPKSPSAVRRTVERSTR